jgi:hypothetical protein
MYRLEAAPHCLRRTTRRRSSRSDMVMFRSRQSLFRSLVPSKSTWCPRIPPHAHV